jgi:hypothetical protein
MKKICLGKGILFWITGTFGHSRGPDDDVGDILNNLCVVKMIMMNN